MKAASIILHRASLSGSQQAFLTSAENREWTILVTATDSTSIVLTAFREEGSRDE